MYRNLFIILLTLIGIMPVIADSKALSSLERLDEAISLRPHYDAAKQQRIDSLRRAMYISENPYFIYRNLYEEYRSYNYDTALLYVQAMHDEAVAGSNHEWRTEAGIRQGFVYLSGGLFHEAYETLTSIPVTDSLPDAYYFTYARLMYDMSAYAEATALSDEYTARGNTYMAQWAARYTPADSSKYWYPMAVIDMHNHAYERSIARMQEAMQCSRLTTHDRAICTSTLGHLYRQIGDNATALLYYIDAAIYDAESSVYETIALRMVAEILYEQGELSLANKYIHIAMHDAQRYHARHRQVSISQLLPIIEQNYAQLFRQRTVTAYVLLSIALILLLAGVIEIVLLRHRQRALRTAQLTINDINQKLSEANHIKEKVLGNTLAAVSQYLIAVQQYQDQIKDHVIRHRTNELMNIPKNVDARLQRQRLNRKIDELVLFLFPTFIEEFNALLPSSQPMDIKKGELLNPSLRIFALIRLGIAHNEVIAQILDYSINTVYSYKTRVINQSHLQPEQFYDALMRIATPR